jgi:hypothetical protein
MSCQKERTPQAKEEAMKSSKVLARGQGKTVGVPLCIWSEAGMVSSRSCTRQLECGHCLFDQNMTDFFADDPKRVPAVPRAA